VHVHDLGRGAVDAVVVALRVGGLSVVFWCRTRRSELASNDHRARRHAASRLQAVAVVLVVADEHVVGSASCARGAAGPRTRGQHIAFSGDPAVVAFATPPRVAVVVERASSTPARSPAGEARSGALGRRAIGAERRTREASSTSDRATRRSPRSRSPTCRRVPARAVSQRAGPVDQYWLM
jgi:hypothetical protein